MCGFSVQSVEAHGTCAELGGEKKKKKKNFTAAEHRVPETKQYSRQGRARSVARKHARHFFVAVRVYFLD